MHHVLYSGYLGIRYRDRISKQKSTVTILTGWARYLSKYHLKTGCHFAKIMKYVRHNNAKKKHTALKSESTSTELRKYQSLIPKEWDLMLRLKLRTISQLSQGTSKNGRNSSRRSVNKCKDKTADVLRNYLCFMIYWCIEECLDHERLYWKNATLWKPPDVSWQIFSSTQGKRQRWSTYPIFMGSCRREEAGARCLLPRKIRTIGH